MGGLTALLLAAALTIPAAGQDALDARNLRFLSLLRSYPQRSPRDTVAQVERLVDEGDFAEHDRAEFWIASVLFSLNDGDAARRWFTRLQHDHQDSVWAERSFLSLGDAATQERRYALAVDWYGKAMSAKDESVREIARVSMPTVKALRSRQILAWAAGAVVVAAAALLGVSLVRHRPLVVWPLPVEARVVLPVLFVLALLSTRLDAPQRAVVLELCAGSALLVILSGLRLRAAWPRGGARAVHAAGTLAALVALAYVAVYRGGMVGMLLETFRAGPE